MLGHASYHHRRAELEADPIIFLLGEIWVSWDTHLLNMRLILQNTACMVTNKPPRQAQELNAICVEYEHTRAFRGCLKVHKGSGFLRKVRLFNVSKK